jgi:hypothetical protein
MVKVMWTEAISVDVALTSDYIAVHIEDDNWQVLVAGAIMPTLLIVDTEQHNSNLLNANAPIVLDSRYLLTDANGYVRSY